ncbi:hypothetical protein LWC34_38785 [Kibdelosporangium philippinense]|uniref:Uncharacterized protein n=1 Tax=Kibdelosporangium philippinense TaxID=211113 RepID=A0ABS8ZLQ2_9PSEU|nr:hypothetical protein [Kibdelosporangium philippinense]MCE7008716.1 hypothetical protein [Kibdelosporangium philippinense]
MWDLGVYTKREMDEMARDLAEEARLAATTTMSTRLGQDPGSARTKHAPSMRGLRMLWIGNTGPLVPVPPEVLDLIKRLLDLTKQALAPDATEDVRNQARQVLLELDSHWLSLSGTSQDGS